MLNLRVRPALGRLVDPVAGGLLRAGVSPDAVTLLGTAGAVAGALACFPAGRFFLGTVVVVVSVLTDLLDGAMARQRGVSSRFGAWLDSTCDRAADAAIFGALVVWGTGRGHDRTLALLALYCLVAGSVVSYAKARAEGLGLTCDVGLVERAERLILVLAATLLLGLGTPVAVAVALLGVLAVLSTVTVGQRLVEVRRQTPPRGP